MSKNRRTAFLATLAVGGAAALAVGTAAASSGNAPETPEWIQPDGTVDLDLAPERVPVVGSDGELARDEEGEVLTVPFSAPLPEAPPTDLKGADAPELEAPQVQDQELDAPQAQTFVETIPPPPADGAPYPLAGDDHT